jgi:hypothetical protein
LPGQIDDGMVRTASGGRWRDDEQRCVGGAGAVSRSGAPCAFTLENWVRKTTQVSPSLSGMVL